MSSKIIYKEIIDNNGEKENIFIKSDDGQSVIQKSSNYSKIYEIFTLKRLLGVIKDVFLPEGFPQSVHPDYVSYQIWDTIQAFASTILGTLTTHSILQGVGVGESTATPLAATISWILKDGTGMIGRILFAWWNGSQLDAQCKKWRIFADVLNDFAMGIELTLPYFASSYTTIILCVSTTMKSIVGVAGGATRAALTQHQALKNNLADVSAKDGSQETFVNLIASFVGIFVLSYLQKSFLGELYAILVIIHIYANYSAVRALRLDSLNEDRLALLLDNYVRTGTLLSVEEANRRESLLIFRNPFINRCGFDIKLGVSFSKIFKRKNLNSIDYISRLSNYFRHSKYFILPNIEDKKIYVGLSNNFEQLDVFKAYFYAYLYALAISLKSHDRPNIATRAEFSESSLFGKLHATSSDSASDCPDSNRLALKAIIDNDLIVATEFKWWYELLTKSEWRQEINSLPLGEWRAQWDD